MIPALIFAAAAALAVYVLAGYPLLLAVWARLRPRPVRAAPYEPAVTVLIAVRDGERWIGEKLRNLRELDYPRQRVRVIVVSDGSTDRTAELAEAAGVEVIRAPREGKAAALNRGLAAATGELLLFTDVRQTLAPQSLRLLAACFADPEVGVVSGELVIGRGGAEEENVGLYWRYEKWIRRHQSLVASVPGATGCLYAMRRSLAKPLPRGTLLDDVNQPLNAYFAGRRIVFEPRAQAYDYPTKLDSEFRRKVRTLAGNYQTIAAYPRLLAPVHPLWLHFVSHKLGRLLLPYALIAMAVYGWLLPAPWPYVVMPPQIALYAAAALDPLVSEASRWKRLTGVARTFVVLMAAALGAVGWFFRPADSFWTATRVAAPRA